MAEQKDLEALATSLMSAAEEILSKMNNMIATEAPQSKIIDIVEYNGRMRANGMDKFNAPSFVSVINYYLNQGDMDKHKAKGALVLYVASENASKLYKALGSPVSEDEDDSSMMGANAKFCNLLAQNFKNELTKINYADLVMSTPHNYKNLVMHGVEYSKDQKTKIELSFFYWKQKTIVIELTLASIPRK